MRKERMYVRLPIGALWYHVRRVKAEAKTRGEEEYQALGRWLEMVAEAICGGDLEAPGDQFLVELADFTDKDFGGAPKGNKNARKKSRKAKENDEND